MSACDLALLFLLADPLSSQTTLLLLKLMIDSEQPLNVYGATATCQGSSKCLPYKQLI